MGMEEATTARTTLAFRDVGDPMQRHHDINRPAHYRLKLLLKRMLRNYGFRIEQCRNPSPEDFSDQSGVMVSPEFWEGE
ncbi:MAG: hypothetical protein LC104_06655 [Bacteroidales bacterium]|nr:hypothetical protein [Bacteroidales bacterium]